MISFLRLILKEFVNFLRSWRNPKKVEIKTSDQGGWVGGCGVLEAGFMDA